MIGAMHNQKNRECIIRVSSEKIVALGRSANDNARVTVCNFHLPLIPTSATLDQLIGVIAIPHRTEIDHEGVHHGAQFFLREVVVYEVIDEFGLAWLAEGESIDGQSL